MEAIYQELTLDRIPWNLEEPPEPLVELVESERLRPCEAVDLGCGAGNYAVWLGSKGFQITGIDISPKAIELARQLASKKGVDCRFIVEDLTGDLRQLDHSFDFAYDWEVLHHVFPEKREDYVRNIRRMLRPGGKYLSVCFSEEDLDFGGEGKYRKTPLGTTLYFSSEEELRGLFEPVFDIHELTTSEIAGKYGSHMALIVLMERE
jgi:SAM-dependent methyltransferase